MPWKDVGRYLDIVGERKVPLGEGEARVQAGDPECRARPAR